MSLIQGEGCNGLAPRWSSALWSWITLRAGAIADHTLLVLSALGAGASVLPLFVNEPEE